MEPYGMNYVMTGFFHKPLSLWDSSLLYSVVSKGSMKHGLNIKNKKVKYIFHKAKFIQNKWLPFHLRFCATIILVIKMFFLFWNLLLTAGSLLVVCLFYALLLF